MGAHGFTIFADAPSHLLALRSDLYVMRLRGTATLATTKAVRDANAQTTALHPEPLLLLVVIDSTMEPPDAPIRAEFAGLMKEFAHRNLADGYLALEGGFRGALVRSVVTGMHLVARTKVPSRTFSDPDQAVAWLATHRRAGTAAESAPALAEGLRALIAG